MSGQITGVTTLNGNTGIFGTISTTNTTNAFIPSVGNFGGNGDKLILYTGTPTAYPYSLGIENSALWYSVPSGASHKFYNSGTNTLSITSTGLTCSTTLNVSGNSVFNNKLSVSPATADVTLFDRNINLISNDAVSNDAGIKIYKNIIQP